MCLVTQAFFDRDMKHCQNMVNTTKSFLNFQVILIIEKYLSDLNQTDNVSHLEFPNTKLYLLIRDMTDCFFLFLCSDT